MSRGGVPSTGPPAATLPGSSRRRKHRFIASQILYKFIGAWKVHLLNRPSLRALPQEISQRDVGASRASQPWRPNGGRGIALELPGGMGQGWGWWWERLESSSHTLRSPPWAWPSGHHLRMKLSIHHTSHTQTRRSQLLTAMHSLRGTEAIYSGDSRGPGGLTGTGQSLLCPRSTVLQRKATAQRKQSWDVAVAGRGGCMGCRRQEGDVEMCPGSPSPAGDRDLKLLLVQGFPTSSEAPGGRAWLEGREGWPLGTPHHTISGVLLWGLQGQDRAQSPGQVGPVQVDPSAGVTQ